MSKGPSFRGGAAGRDTRLRTLALWVAQVVLVLYFLYCVQAASYMRGKADGLAEIPPFTSSALQEAVAVDPPRQAMVSMTERETRRLGRDQQDPQGHGKGRSGGPATNAEKR